MKLRMARSCVFGSDNSAEFFSSLIVTGCSPWTVYEYDNYQGSSVCFYPLDTINCYPGFYDTPDVMGGISRKMSSALKGCFAEKKLFPKPVPKGVVQKFLPSLEVPIHN